MTSKKERDKSRLGYHPVNSPTFRIAFNHFKAIIRKWTLEGLEELSDEIKSLEVMDYLDLETKHGLVRNVAYLKVSTGNYSNIICRFTIHELINDNLPETYALIARFSTRYHNKVNWFSFKMAYYSEEKNHYTRKNFDQAKEEYKKTLAYIIPEVDRVTKEKFSLSGNEELLMDTLERELGHPTQKRIWSKKVGNFTVRTSRRPYRGKTPQKRLKQKVISVYIDGTLEDFFKLPQFRQRMFTLRQRLNVDSIDQELSDLLTIIEMEDLDELDLVDFDEINESNESNE